VCGSSPGQWHEQQHSKQFHSQGLPLLVSSQLLRSRQLGQIDLARLVKDGQDWLLEVAEVKSSGVGVAKMQSSQYCRLQHAQRFLAALLGYRARLIKLIN
jgi:hypothetical protein